MSKEAIVEALATAGENAFFESQVACIARHGLDSPYMVQVLKTLVEKQTLIAVTAPETLLSPCTASMP